MRVYIPSQIRTGMHVSWFLIVDNELMAAFQPWVEQSLETVIAHLDAPPRVASGSMVNIDVMGNHGFPAVGLAWR